MKKTITVQMDSDKVAALEMYLAQKDTTAVAELEKYIDQLYRKSVPQNVQDYIELMSKMQAKPKAKPQKSSPTDSVLSV